MDFVRTGCKMLIDQNFYQLAQGIVNFERNQPRFRRLESDSGRWVKRIRIVFRQVVTGWHLARQVFYSGCLTLIQPLLFLFGKPVQIPHRKSIGPSML